MKSGEIDRYPDHWREDRAGKTPSVISGNLPDSWRELSADDVPKESIPIAIGLLQRLNAELWARLTTQAKSNEGATSVAEKGGFLGVEQVAEILGVSKSWVYRNWRKQLLSATKKVGKYLKFSEPDLRRWMARGRR